ncbi:unnamed protein product [Caenorhabditis auriculariae]|uniref:Cyclic nucleotide-binding domain-containing protein n=1 Tax=Caenorhabditis auriculariae TaxID=2777116 RepID=A0A8S1H8R2_9PELO|nr:unnamed protein product [Caenorhabditis auriculariae]
MFLNENISQIFLGFILGVIIYSLFSYFINVWRSHCKFSKEKLKNNQNSKEEVESENPSAESDSERVDFTDENGYRRHIRRQIPSEFYEPSDRPPIPEHLRPEIFHVLHHLEMLELPSSWQLKPEDVEVKSYRAKEYIVRPGDPLDSMYVAVEGELQINIMLTGRKSRQYPVKIITQGGCFFSVLSILDALKDAPPIKNLTSLRAATDCRVAKYSFASFRSAMLERPADWLRPVQVVITRLRHVTLATLHTYMGFNWQLLNQNRLCPTETVYANYLKIPKESRLEKACEWLADALGIREKASVLRNLVSLEEFPVGTVLVKQNTRDEDLFFLLSGSFLICR